MDNRSLPEATVIPVLHYAEVRSAVDWLCRAFGFRERLRIAGHRSQLRVGSGAIVVAQATEPPSPESSKPAQSTMIRVADVDAHCARSRGAGARVVSEPSAYPYGERQYTAVDPEGHVWTFSETIADVDPTTWGGALVEGERASAESRPNPPPDGLPIYRILTGIDDAAFCHRVAEALALGYELYGSPAATFNGEAVIVAQALVWPRR